MDNLTRYVGVIAEQLIEIKEELKELTQAVIDIRETMEVDEEVAVIDLKDITESIKGVARSILDVRETIIAADEEFTE